MNSDCVTQGRIAWRKTMAQRKCQEWPARNNIYEALIGYRDQKRRACDRRASADEEMVDPIPRGGWPPCNHGHLSVNGQDAVDRRAYKLGIRICGLRDDCEAHGNGAERLPKVDVEQRACYGPVPVLSGEMNLGLL